MSLCGSGSQPAGQGTTMENTDITLWFTTLAYYSHEVAMGIILWLGSQKHKKLLKDHGTRKAEAHWSIVVLAVDSTVVELDRFNKNCFRCSVTPPFRFVFGFFCCFVLFYFVGFFCVTVLEVLELTL